MEIDSSFRKVAGSLDLNKSKICTHCHTTKTSLWRNGPLGRKSLCNACGIQYQRRGMKTLELESKGNKGKNKMGSCTEGVQNQRRGMKTLKLGSNSEKGKKKNKNKRSKVELGMVMTTVDCQKESVPPQSQQHGDEVEKAAMQLMYLSGATQYLNQ